MSESDRSRAYQLAYEESVRALGQQSLTIDGFRIRAGVLLSAGVVTTSLLGARALELGQIRLLGWIALLAFAGSVAFSMAALWPRQWEFSANSGEIIATYIESVDPLPLSGIHRDLALHFQASIIENRKGLERITVWFRWSVILLITEVLAWVADYAIRA